MLSNRKQLTMNYVTVRMELKCMHKLRKMLRTFNLHTDLGMNIKITLTHKILNNRANKSREHFTEKIIKCTAHIATHSILF